LACIFIVGLPRTHDGYDSIWVIVDRLTKVAHFIPVQTTYTGAKLAELYMSRIVCLHGVPKKIVSGRGTQFTSRFWEKLHESMDTKLNFSSAYHPQTNGQTERTNQIMEDMLRACALKMEVAGIRVFPMLSSLTTTTITLVSRWHPLRHFMEESVEHLCIGAKQERVSCLELISLRKQKGKFRS
jgi:transposase InsO family protein